MQQLPAWCKVIDQAQIEDALRETCELFEGDGVGLELVGIDVEASRIAVRVDLTAVDCIECVLPPEVVADIVTTALVGRIDIPGVVVLVDDPRAVPPVGSQQEEMQ